MLQSSNSFNRDKWIMNGCGYLAFYWFATFGSFMWHQAREIYSMVAVVGWGSRWGRGIFGVRVLQMDWNISRLLNIRFQANYILCASTETCYLVLLLDCNPPGVLLHFLLFVLFTANFKAIMQKTDCRLCRKRYFGVLTGSMCSLMIGVLQ